MICKAADAGYKIIIVLAGMHNNLRSQTQIRLEEAFLGYETSPNREPGNPIGVFWEDSDPSIHPHCATTRADKGDFNASVARHFSISPEERPWLFVVKKNKSVLTKLLKWIHSRHVADATDPETGRKMVTKLPLLVIDDEADHASVDTGEQVFDAEGVPDENHQPKAINSLIRQILHSFSKSAYVGYTATPFANIFIHRGGETCLEGPDLFPQSFIKNISAPSNYVGPARVFGLRAPDGRTGGLPLSRDIKDHVSADGETGWMPPKHNKTHEPLYGGMSVVPTSLRKAICSFVLACAARVCRGQGNEHSSMLVHVTRFTDVQDAVMFQVEEEMAQMRRRLARKVDHEELIVRLHNLWNEDFVPTSQRIAEEAPEAFEEQKIPSWKEIEAVLPSVVSDIIVKTVNGNAKDALDYVEHSEKGLKVIAVGGDKLARGLTLEGLCVSYFVRTTKMYDTLMQMGRWFGYRPGYLDLCRLYTTAELVKWFGTSPTHRKSCAKSSIRWPQQERLLGIRFESGVSSRFACDFPSENEDSQDAVTFVQWKHVTDYFVHRRCAQPEGEHGCNKGVACSSRRTSYPRPVRNRAGVEDSWKRSVLWGDVDAEQVLDFLRAYRTPPGADRANTAVMARVHRSNERGG